MTKIEALRKTIYNLENDVYVYKWSNPESCNCGIVAKTLLGGNLDRCDFEKHHAFFSESAKCLKTGLALPRVFDALNTCGFTYEELRDLEFLKDPNICNRANILLVKSGSLFSDFEGLNCKSKPTLIAYLKAWVSILEESPVKEPSLNTAKSEPEVKEKVVIKYVIKEREIDANNIAEQLRELEVVGN